MLDAISKSYQSSLQAWEGRVSAGHQPDLPLTDFTSLTCANIFYLGFTLALYLYMKRRQAFQCGIFKHILLLYNLLCVVAAGYVVWGIAAAHFERPFKFVCNTDTFQDHGGNAVTDRFVAHVFWVFYAQKFWEFLDTWFFMLRKSFRQVSFLHIFHHCSINIVVGIILPFSFNGDMYLPILLNAFVHVLMYSHYLASSLGVRTWWKPYLTSIQLLQFCLIATQSAISLRIGDSCGPPYFAKVLMVSYMASMLILFANFFFKSYVLKKPSGFGDGVVKHPGPLLTTRTHTGRVTFDAEGRAEAVLSTTYSCGELSYHIMPLGKPMPQLHIVEEPVLEGRSFLIAGGLPGMTATWTATEVVSLFERVEKPKYKSPCCPNPQDPNDQKKDN